MLQALQANGLIQIKEPELTIDTDTLSSLQVPSLLKFVQDLSENIVERLRDELHVYAMSDEVSETDYFYESMFPHRFMSQPSQPRRPYHIYDSTAPIGKGTWNAALHSANLAYVAAQQILQGQPLSYAMCRPPGHHAGRDFMGGYCYLNNAAIAAQQLRSLGRVAILDIDYHHGNGTQDIFWDAEDVLFTSIHAAPEVDYPYYAGFAEERGSADTIRNYPLPHGTQPLAYQRTLDQALTEISAFGPASLVISLGFDTYIKDPMAYFNLEIETYAEIGHSIQQLALPSVYIQEGGYYLPDLGAMAVSFFQGVLA